jgi:hypothetical protein
MVPAWSGLGRRQQAVCHPVFKGLRGLIRRAFTHVEACPAATLHPRGQATYCMQFWRIAFYLGIERTIIGFGTDFVCN